MNTPQKHNHNQRLSGSTKENGRTNLHIMIVTVVVLSLLLVIVWCRPFEHRDESGFGSSFPQVLIGNCYLFTPAMPSTV